MGRTELFSCSSNTSLIDWHLAYCALNMFREAVANTLHLGLVLSFKANHSLWLSLMQSHGVLLSNNNLRSFS